MSRISSSRSGRPFRDQIEQIYTLIFSTAGGCNTVDPVRSCGGFEDRICQYRQDIERSATGAQGGGAPEGGVWSARGPAQGETAGNPGNSLTSNARRKLEREIRLKVSQLKFLEQEFREDQNLRRNEEIRELQQVISNVLEMQGDSGKFDLILTEGVSYVSDQIDITSQTIEMLKQLPESSEESQ